MIAVPQVRPIFLFLALMAKLRQAEPVRTARFRCRFCKADVGGRTTTHEAPVYVHPANGCRFGKRGLCAVPVEAMEATGRDHVFSNGATVAR